MKTKLGFNQILTIKFCSIIKLIIYAFYIQVELGLIIYIYIWNFKSYNYVLIVVLSVHQPLINHGPRPRKRIKAIITYCTDKKRRNSHVRTWEMWVSQWYGFYTIYIIYGSKRYILWGCPENTISCMPGCFSRPCFEDAYIVSNQERQVWEYLQVLGWNRRHTWVQPRTWRSCGTPFELWSFRPIFGCFPHNGRGPGRRSICPFTSLQGSSWQRQWWGHVGGEYFGLFWGGYGWQLQEEFAYI